MRVADSTGRAQQAGHADKAAASGFESARTYFDQARKLGFPAAGQSAPYVLKAEFTTRGSSGVVETGTYTDTWVSDTKWRREAVLGKSQFVRSQNGKKRYRVAEGPDAPLLQFVLTAMEPLPATDALFAESDWKDEARRGGWRAGDTGCERARERGWNARPEGVLRLLVRRERGSW